MRVAERRVSVENNTSFKLFGIAYRRKVVAAAHVRGNIGMYAGPCAAPSGNHRQRKIKANL